VAGWHAVAWEGGRRASGAAGPGAVRVPRPRLFLPAAGQAVDTPAGVAYPRGRGRGSTGDYGGLPVLADPLEEAGCAAADLLAHCRSGGPAAG